MKKIKPKKAKQAPPDSIRLPADVKEILRKEAKELDRSLSYLIISILKKHCKIVK